MLSWIMIDGPARTAWRQIAYLPNW